ncbi:hypothetical protein BH11ACT3_BH11ACT3_03670 [soil metagenome]
MTTTTTVVRPPAGAFERITRITRLLLANPWTTIALPWIVIGGVFALNWLIWLILFTNLDSSDSADAREGIQYSGASSWMFVYMFIIAVQAINLAFPLALGYGATRRDFYIGAALTFVLLSAMYAVGLTILSVIEELTNGWGLGGTMFTAIYFGGDVAWYVRLAIYFFGLLFFFFIGSVFATLWVRWKTNGMIVGFGLLGLVLVGLAALFTYTASWDRVGEFFAHAGALGTATWLLVPTAIAAVAGFFVLRRATPRS